ncbi:MAG: hypothetical protein JRD00_03665 [Deltaproteobacteria bacterium]|nr:hypothetical protein [Deltaproteobacteria bacterium]
MSIVPEGENARKAIKWISDKRQYEPDECGPVHSMIEQAAKRFDLSNSSFVFFAVPKRPKYKNLLNIFSG